MLQFLCASLVHACMHVTCAVTCTQVLYSVFYGQQPRVPDDTPAAFRTLLQVCSSDPHAHLISVGPILASMQVGGSRAQALSDDGSSWNACLNQ